MGLHGFGELTKYPSRDFREIAAVFFLENFRHVGCKQNATSLKLPIYTKIKIYSPNDLTIDARSECDTCSLCHASREKRPHRCATAFAVSALSSYAVRYIRYIRY